MASEYDLVDGHPVQEAFIKCKNNPTPEEFDNLQKAIFEVYRNIESYRTSFFSEIDELKEYIDKTIEENKISIYSVNEKINNIPDVTKNVDRLFKKVESKVDNSLALINKDVSKIKVDIEQANKVYKKISEKAEILEKNQKKVKRIRLIDTVPEDIKKILTQEIIEENKGQNKRIPEI